MTQALLVARDPIRAHGNQQRTVSAHLCIEDLVGHLYADRAAKEAKVPICLILLILADVTCSSKRERTICDATMDNGTMQRYPLCSANQQQCARRSW
jgi:hypothetical protein